MAFAVFAGAPAQAFDRPLPEGSYQVAQETGDPRVFTLEEEIRQLTGKLEELSYQVLELQEQLRKAQEDNEFRFQQLEGGGAPPASADGTPADHTDAGPAALPAPAGSAQA
ncbi:MAG: YbgF trimerization domain-containing protein, partial [Oricola sp.]